MGQVRCRPTRCGVGQPGALPAAQAPHASGRAAGSPTRMAPTQKSGPPGQRRVRWLPPTAALPICDRRAPLTHAYSVCQRAGVIGYSAYEDRHPYRVAARRQSRSLIRDSYSVQDFECHISRAHTDRGKHTDGIRRARVPEDVADSAVRVRLIAGTYIGGAPGHSASRGAGKLPSPSSGPQLGGAPRPSGNSNGHPECQCIILRHSPGPGLRDESDRTRSLRNFECVASNNIALSQFDLSFRKPPQICSVDSKTQSLRFEKRGSRDSKTQC